jgi:hypothetical protein
MHNIMAYVDSAAAVFVNAGSNPWDQVPNQIPDHRFFNQQHIYMAIKHIQVSRPRGEPMA